MLESPNFNSSTPFDIKQEFESLIESCLTKYYPHRCYVGLILQQGKRIMLQINAPASDIPNLLQAKPASANNPDAAKDRPEIKDHADEIKQYIVERASQEKPWIIGTLTANIAPERITVVELGKGMCIVVIQHGVKLDIADGQHRKKAIEKLLENNHTRKLISDEYFPITIILEDNYYQCKADFRDMSKAKPVDKSLLVSFGESPRDRITQKLIEKVPMFRGKTDKIKKSPSKKDKLIYTTNYIARAVSCAFTDSTEDSLEIYDADILSEALAKCLNQFFAECSQTRYLFETRVEKLTLQEVSAFREECLLGVSVGIEILGRLLNYTYNQENNRFAVELISQLAQLDWSRENSLWHNNVVRINLKSKNSTKTISWGASAIGDAVKAAKNTLKWN